MSDIFDEVAKKRDIFDDVSEMGGSMPISTNSGQPIPTPAENMLTMKRAGAELLPIAGDLAGTALAPQLKLAASAPRIARGAAGLANILSKSLGSGAGSVTGEVEKQLLTKEFDPNQIYMQGAVGAGGEAAMGLAGAGLKAVEKPALELLSDLTLSGSKIKQVLTDRLKQYTEKRAKQFIESVAPESVKSKLSDSGLNQAISETLDETKALYNHFKSTLDDIASKNNGAVPLEKTQNAMQAWLKENIPQFKSQAAAENYIVRELGFSPSSTKGQQHISIRRLLRGEDLSPDEMNYLLGNLFEKKTKDWLELHPETRGLRETLKNQILQDLDGLGVAAGKRSADEVFKETKRFQAVKSIFDRATVVNKETGETKFLPWAFAENVKASEGMIRKTMPEIWPKLKAEADYFAEAADRLQRGGRNLGVPLMLSGLASSYFTSGIPVAEVFGAASAWALMSPVGRSALDGVFKYALKPIAKSSLHIGGHLIDFQQAH